MKIAVIGAGIVGVTTAYELASDGHEVTVLDAFGSVAEGASFANAGVVAPGYVTPWAAPGMRGKVIKALFAAHSPVRVKLPLSPTELAWATRWWGACKPQLYAANRKRMQQLALYSKERMRQIIEVQGLQIDRADGYTVLLRSRHEQQLMAPGLAVLHELGVKVQQLDADQTRAIEPALNPDTPLFGGLHLPDDEVGNCRQFAQQLRDTSRAMGVQWLHRVQVKRVESAAKGVRLHCAALEGPHSSLDVAPESWVGDAVVICAGVGSAELLKPMGVNLPLVPVWGYSISAPIKEHLHAPRSAVMDERYKVAISRLGLRVRAAGSAELGGAADAMSKPALDTLYKVLNDWFPGAAQTQHAQVWKGGRPMLPEGPPVIGSTGTPNVWINTGHGSSGWALSCGGARVLADQLAGRSPSLDVSGLELSRYLRR